MTSRSLLLAALCVTWLSGNVSLFGQTANPAAKSVARPNLIFILADDLGYGDLGCYGQQTIKTPNLDRMAAEGMRFTQFYAGCTVCAPSRSVLMTGLHTGHTHVRGNARGDLITQTLRDEDFTVAECLRDAGYYNALIGKWGLGELNTSGHPLKQGFQEFFGYLNQTHAHNYYPEFLWRGTEKQRLANVVDGKYSEAGDFVAGAATKRVEYSHDLFAAEALQFVQQHQTEQFFLFLAFTTPHANNEGSNMTGNGAEVPDYGIYKDRDWPDQDKGQAAMITRMDRDIGRLLDKLRELGIADNTLVFFTSDNGPHNEARHNLDRFKPAGPLQGIKRSMHEGGIRVPGLAWWPKHVPAGTTTDMIGYSGDWFATAAELAGAKAPAGLDSISLVPTLLGKPASEQPQHRYLYWEFYEQGSRQAVRFGKWKAIREPMLNGKIRLYDVEVDQGEVNDVANQNPEEVKLAGQYMDEAHVNHPNWQVPNVKEKGARPAK